jgi:hypothetical protein
MVSLIRRLTPPPSAACFLVGAGDDENARIEEVARWLASTCPSLGKTTTCVILDPFFDEPGAEVIRNTKAPNAEMIVITNSQCFSYDDSEALIGILLGCAKKVYRALAPRDTRDNLFPPKLKKLFNAIGKAVWLRKGQEPQRAKRIREYGYSGKSVGRKSFSVNLRGGALGGSVGYERWLAVVSDGR